MQSVKKPLFWTMLMIPFSISYTFLCGFVGVTNNQKQLLCLSATSLLRLFIKGGL